VGMLLLASKLNTELAYAEKAKKLASEIYRSHINEDTYDRGFLFRYSSAIGADLLNDNELKGYALEGANKLVEMFISSAGIIPIGREAKIGNAANDATIDCMMNLGLLWWAWKRTGMQKYYDVAFSHAKTTMQWHVRKDGSAIQSVHFNPKNGQLIENDTHQGYSPQTCWSRGQAWCIHGFTEAYRNTGYGPFLEVALKSLNFYLNNLPDDLVPYYDFFDPRIPHVKKDSSAATITLSAIARLLTVELSQSERAYYQSFLHRMLNSVVNTCLIREGRKDLTGILKHGCYNFKRHDAIDNELIWGDYYLLEVLFRLLDSKSL
jgi:unsaturated chondroitin disaccharide hydrolase